MAIVTFYQSADMLNPQIFYGSVNSATSTSITISDNLGQSGTYAGSFYYSNNNLSGGTVTGYTAYKNSSLSATLRGVSVDALTVNAYLNSNNAVGLYQMVLNGADAINGSAVSDYLKSWSGNDTLFGGQGDDSLDGGDGVDTALYSNRSSDYQLSYSAGVITVSSSLDGVDKLSNIEKIQFADKILSLDGFNGLNYIASYSDLINVFGANANAGVSHYINNGFKEGRVASFDSLKYIASYSDLINVFGTNSSAATSHYITNGFKEGRTATFDALKYLASYTDLLNAFGNDTNAATTHYINNGYKEGRTTTNFNGLEYIASNADLVQAFGANIDAAISHYVNYGYNEHRAVNSFNALNYIASNSDLINAFGTDTDAALNHYINYGYKEHRSTDNFNVDQYLNNYSDLRAAFGNNTQKALQHYISFGVNEHRTGALINTSGNDTLTGGNGNNVLNGGLGNDILTGGAGSDLFVFNTTPNASTNLDTVNDFVSGTDKLQFSKAVFSGLGSQVGNLSSAQFWSGNVTSAHDADDRLVYNTSSGALYYDADGQGGSAAVQIALIGGHPALAYTDIQIIA